jgi:hypothetical protein
VINPDAALGDASFPIFTAGQDTAVALLGAPVGGFWNHTLARLLLSLNNGSGATCDLGVADLYADEVVLPDAGKLTIGGVAVSRPSANVLGVDGAWRVGRTTANDAIQIRGRNDESDNVQIGELTSTDYGAGVARNNIVLRALANTPGANIRLEVLDSTTHIGFNKGAVANSQVTVMQRNDISDGHISIRSATAADNTDISKQSVLIQETNDWRQWNLGGGDTIFASGANATDEVARIDQFGFRFVQRLRTPADNNMLVNVPTTASTGNGGRFVALEMGSSVSAVLALQHNSGNTGAGALAGAGAGILIQGRGKIEFSGASVTNPTNREFANIDMRADTQDGDLVISTSKAGTGSDRNVRLMPATLAAYIHGAVTLVARSATGVPNNSIFLDSADNVLKKKNNSGTVSNL